MKPNFLYIGILLVYFSITVNAQQTITSNTDSLLFGQQVIEITGHNTQFTQGTLIAFLGVNTFFWQGTRMGMSVTNDTSATVYLEYFPDSRYCEDIDLVIQDANNSWVTDFFDTTDNHCYDFIGMQPNTAYRNQTLDVTVSGANLAFNEVTTLGNLDREMFIKKGNTTINATGVAEMNFYNVQGTFAIPNSAPCGYYELYYGVNTPNAGAFLVDSFLVDCGVNLSGIVYRDANQNGIKDSQEAVIPRISIETNPGNLLSATNHLGKYFLNAPPDTFSLDVILPKHHQSSTPPYNFILPFGTSIDTLDFGIYLPNNINDLGVFLTSNTPANGSPTNFWIYYENYGSERYNATITLNIDTTFNYISALPSPTTINGNVLEWVIDTMESLSSNIIEINTNTQWVPFGTMVSSDVIIGPLIGDLDTSDNRDFIYEEVLGSYDPNDKKVKPARDDSINLTLFEEDLTYTIRFQNTGNYYAFNVRLEDTLDQNIDFSTIELLAYSHPVEFTLNGEGILHFYFNNIMLPDSGRDEPGSHGFVKYSISPNDSLDEMTEIQNTAHIYFDFNEAIVTNTTLNTMVSKLPDIPIDTTAIEEIISEGGIHVSPNPFKNQTLIRFPNAPGDEYQLLLYNLQGQEVKRINGITGNNVILKRDDLQTGVYIVELRGTNTFRAKVLIE